MNDNIEQAARQCAEACANALSRKTIVAPINAFTVDADTVEPIILAAMRGGGGGETARQTGMGFVARSHGSDSWWQRTGG